MEKELKISELAELWHTSVPTTWNRIKKMGLKTFIKKNESNKEINYIRISDEQINEYVIKDVNNVNNNVNNGYYEDLLNFNKDYKDLNNINNCTDNGEKTHLDGNLIKETIETLTTVNNDYNERLMKVYNDYNERLQEVNNELINFKSKTLLLEDKAGREGLYINEINELKKDNNRQRILIYLLITVIVFLIFGLIGYLTYNITVNNLHDSVNNVSETVINDKKPAAVQTAPQPAKNASNQHKK